MQKLRQFRLSQLLQPRHFRLQAVFSRKFSNLQSAGFGASLALVIRCWERHGPLKLLEVTMVADQLVGPMAEIHLGELRKALELARSNRSPAWLAVRPVFERIAGEIGQSPEFARAFLSSQIVRELVEAGRKWVEIDSKVDTENVALLLYQAFLGTLLLWSLRGTSHLELAVRAAFHQLADVWRFVRSVSGMPCRLERSEFRNEPLGLRPGCCWQRSELAKSMMLGDEAGVLKLLFAPCTRKLLGAHAIGQRATEIIHIGQAVIFYSGSVEYFRDMFSTIRPWLRLTRSPRPTA